MVEHSPVASYYSNKNVLITGGLGFLGKLLIEKLLRTCSDIAGIYVIIRERKGCSPDERLNKTLDDMVYDKLKVERPEFKKKVHAISGDLQYEELGLHSSDKELLIKKINIVIHCGATVNFDISLKAAVLTNVRGTRDIITLSEQMENLNCVLYISTAYSQSCYYTSGEFFCPAPIQLDTLINMMEEMDDAAIENMTNSFLGIWPNVYTFTKAVTEAYVQTKIDTIPIGILRPSIVIPTYKEPCRGWTDNHNGPVAVVSATAAGILRVYPGDITKKMDVIPADFVTNNIICAIPDVAKQFEQHLDGKQKNIIYNSVATMNNAISTQQFKYQIEGTYKLKFSTSIYYPFIIYTPYTLLFYFYSIFLHFLPALLFDTYRIIRGKKPLFVKLYKKIYKLIQLTKRFRNNEFYFYNPNNNRLWNELTDVDKKLFNFDMTSLNLDDYFAEFLYGIKKYLFKEKMDEQSIIEAENKYKRLVLIHTCVKFTVYMICAFIIWKLFQSYFLL